MRLFSRTKSRIRQGPSVSTAAQQQVNYALYFKRWPHCGGIQARLHKLMGYCSDVYISETLRLWSFKWVFFLATSDSWFIGKTKVINILAIEFWLLDTSGLLNPLTLQEFRIDLSSSFYFVHLPEIGNNFWYY